MKFKTTMLSW